MPHASLLRLAGARPPLAVDVLRQANVGDAGSLLANQMDVRVEDGGVHWLAVFTQNCGDNEEGTWNALCMAYLNKGKLKSLSC